MAQDENKTYQVTATRKRPKSFETLIGQEFVVSTLENALKEGKIAHAYLFSGPRGVGKTSSARLLAKALNCEKGISAHPYIHNRRSAHAEYQRVQCPFEDH